MRARTELTATMVLCPLIDLKKSFFVLLCAMLSSGCCTSRAPSTDNHLSRELHWLEPGNQRNSGPGTTAGVPWPRGAVARDATFVLHNSAGLEVPMQVWPIAYWPDGSVKWTGHAIIPQYGSGPFRLELGDSAPVQYPLTVSEDDRSVTVNTNSIACHIPKTGHAIIESITRGNQTIATNVRLICLRRNSPDLDADGSLEQESFGGQISSITIEQKGPIRAVIKIEGKHASQSGRTWLPFIIRLYFYVNTDAIRIMHTIIFDGDQNKDFISGLGVRFSVPMHDELYDRHVRFAGEGDGLWAEAVQGLTGEQHDPGQDIQRDQLEGRKTPARASWEGNFPQSLDYIPAFGDFTLSQLSSDAFEIRKRTRPGFTWLNAATGHRAAGLGYVGGANGGMAFGIRNFWQSYPSQLSISNAASDNAEVTAWLWSPEARPMDMRFYHDDMGMTTYATQIKGLTATYEDYEPGFATATGVARTSELMLWPLYTTPSRDETVKMASVLKSPPQLVCRPQDYKNAGVFGGAIWDLPNRSNPIVAKIEDELNFFLNFYEQQVDQRHWYGFWYFGNVMHRYDFDRHVWRYDVGGYAWDNSEQSTDMWLWYSFLRTGRADLYRFAEAMTRHTGEVDVYHLGRFAGLGTRHGVVPWGDSSKQLRVSTAENRRFFYYLTADERVGDLMREELTADRTAGRVPVERKVERRLADATGKPYPMNFLVGIEWTSIASAWLTEWERTGDTKYRDKLIASMKSIAALPHGWMSGGGGYDPETGQFVRRDDEFYVNPLSVVFGGFEVNAELLELLDVPEYTKTWLDYCKYYNAPPEEQKKAWGKAFTLYLTQAHSRLTAYAACKTNDHPLAQRAWKEFLSGGGGGIPLFTAPSSLNHVSGPAVLSPVDWINISTNQADGFGLAAIENLAMIRGDIPKKLPHAP